MEKIADGRQMKSYAKKNPHIRESWAIMWIEISGETYIIIIIIIGSSNSSSSIAFIVLFQRWM
jgi:hypothetical protein